DYMEALRARRQLAHALRSGMSGLDVAVSLSSQYFPCLIDDEEALARTYDAQARSPFNLTGLPAMAIPIRLSSHGLPIGLQLSAQAGHAASLIAIAMAMERSGFCGFQPPVPCGEPSAATPSSRRQRHA